VLAGQFLSAGPAFHGYVTGDEARFAEQLQFLARDVGLPNSTASYQTYLWDLHVAGQPGFASGISAFPSVHVGIATLNALFLYEYSRRLGYAAFAYAALIIASSVYLGWHYAVDGYAAVAIVLAIHLALRKAFSLARETQPVGAVATA
jgi:membrane-associated phospholipid phosphatase